MTQVLVVDDREHDRELLATVLGYAGYDVVSASSGAEGLEVARALRSDLVISDVLMPEMDGYEFIRNLRADPATAELRVVFCTATYSSDEIEALAEACGVSHVLVKPLEPEEILAAVRDALTTDREPGAPLADADFRSHLRVLNGKLVAKIAELEHAERQGAELLTLLETLQQSAPIGFGLVDGDGRFIRLNETLAAVHGTPLDAQVGCTIAELVPGLWEQIAPSLHAVHVTGHPVINLEIDGETPARPGVRCWLSSFYPVRVADETIGIGIVVVDITERRRADELRAAVMDTMAEGVFVCDPDGAVVYVNAAAAEMTGWEPDELRGGSLDAIVHPERSSAVSEPSGLCALAGVRADGTVLRQADATFTRRDGTAFPVAFSGSALRTGHAITGTVVVFRDVTEERAEQLRVQRELDALTWVGRIRDAFLDDRFVLYSQPIVRVDGGPGGEELLIRMRSSAGELIPPGDFLPVAEKYGLIEEIDRWVIRQAAGLAAQGRHVGVNLSARSVGDQGLLRVIESQFADAGADAALVTFEITETALMDDLEAGERFARGLADMGAGVALDDFGTGFGSFTYLKRLPLRYLKIDMDFVRDLRTNPANQHLVKAIVGLARDFGYETIAEGVEDAETLALLEGFGVDLVQGYHLGRPAPV